MILIVDASVAVKWFVLEPGRPKARRLLGGELPYLFAELCPLASLAQRALAIAQKLRHPAYACFYLALAETKDANVVIADRRFAQRLTGTPWQARTMKLWKLELPWERVRHHRAADGRGPSSKPSRRRNRLGGS